MFEVIFTIGCFDKFHKGHVKLLENMKEKAEKIIVGLHDNNSIQKLKNITNIDSYENRKKNLQKYAYDVFMIDDVDPTNTINQYILTHYCNYKNEINETFIHEDIKTRLDYNDFELYGTDFSKLISNTDENIFPHHDKCNKLSIGIRGKHFYKDDNYSIYNERDYNGNLFKGNGYGRMIINKNNSEYKSKIFDLHKNKSNNQGSEDYRYITYKNELYIVLSALPKESNKRQMYLYNIEKDKICLLSIKGYDVSKIYQKNWTPYVYKNELYFIYSFCELCVVKLKNETGECELVYGTPALFTNKTIFGGTNLYYWKNDLFIGFAHTRQPWYPVPIIFDAKNYKYITTITPTNIIVPFKINLLNNKIVQYPYYFTKYENYYELSLCYQDFYSITYKITTTNIDSLFTNLLNYNDLKAIKIGPSKNNNKVIEESYVGDLFFIHKCDDTFEYCCKNNNITITRTDKNGGWGQNLIAYKKNWCFMRADDNKQFPSINYVKTIMPIEYLPYSKEISATKIRNYKNNKLGLMNYLLNKVVDILNENNIPYYLDCGTLLGCIRENNLMEKDSDVDVTIHLSYWDKLKSIDFSNYKLIRTRTLTGFPKQEAGNMISVKTEYSNFYCDIYTNPAFPQLDTKVLNGKNYNIPLNSELYLTQLYGNWKIPSGKHASTKYHRGNGLVNSEYFKYWDKKFEIFKCNM